MQTERLEPSTSPKRRSNTPFSEQWPQNLKLLGNDPNNVYHAIEYASDMYFLRGT